MRDFCLSHDALFVRYEVTGKGNPDALVVPLHRAAFFIELKGEGTGYSERVQGHQEDVAKQIKFSGRTVLRLSPKQKDWKTQIKVLCI